MAQIHAKSDSINAGLLGIFIVIAILSGITIIGEIFIKFKCYAFGRIFIRVSWFITGFLAIVALLLSGFLFMLLLANFNMCKIWDRAFVDKPYADSIFSNPESP
jgi:hypothetical protein